MTENRERLQENSWITPSEHVEREECPNGCPTLAAWAFCASCGADLVVVRYRRES